MDYAKFVYWFYLFVEYLCKLCILLIKVWDRRALNEKKPKPVGLLAGHIDGITYIDPKGDGRHLISNCKDQTIKLWDMRVFSPSIGKFDIHVVAKMVVFIGKLCL